MTLVHGQNHHGSTYHISEMVKEKLQTLFPELEVEEFFLPQDFSKQCIGCFRCIVEGKEHCPHRDEVKPIEEALISSQIILIDSPTYCMEMTGQLKSFFDHQAYRWMPHRPEESMFSKRGIVVSTAAGAGAKRVTKSLAKQLFYWGIPRVHSLAYSVNAMSFSEVSLAVKERIRQDVDRLGNRISGESKAPAPGIKTKVVFGVMGKMQSSNDYNETDRNYWKDKGWLDKERPWK